MSLNEKWNDHPTWAQRVIAHSKCCQTLKSERLYCRQASVSHEDPNNQDFDPEVDLAAAVHQISKARSEEIDDFEPLTYEQVMASPNQAVERGYGQANKSHLRPWGPGSWFQSRKRWPCSQASESTKSRRSLMGRSSTKHDGSSEDSNRFMGSTMIKPSPPWSSLCILRPGLRTNGRRNSLSERLLERIDLRLVAERIRTRSNGVSIA